MRKEKENSATNNTQRAFHSNNIVVSCNLLFLKNSLEIFFIIQHGLLPNWQ